MADINAYWLKANDMATKYEICQRKRVRLEFSRNQHYTKNEQVYRLATLAKIICVMMIVPFLLAGVYEGIIVAPIFEAAYLQGLTDNKSWQQLASYLPMTALLGLSLATGLCLHNISAKADPLIPNKRQITWGWVIGAGLGLSLYIGCLYFLTSMANESLEGSGMESALSLIPVWGGLEIFVGMFAACGFEILWVHVVGWVLERRCRNNDTAMTRCVQSCQENYHYYQQMLRHWNQTQQTEMEEHMTPAVKAILFKSSASKIEEAQLQ